MTEYDANLELARRVDASRRTCCADVEDDLSAARGIIFGVILSLPLSVCMLVGGYFLVQWLKGLGW